jgi:LEA14-like dessication related protein
MKFFIFITIFGCFIPRYRVDIVSVELKDVSLTATEFNVDVLLYYKWIFPLKVSDIHYKFIINDVVVAEGKYPETLKFGRKVNTTLSFPITLNNFNLPSVLIQTIINREFKYELEMDLKLNMWKFKKKRKIINKGVKKL